MLYAIVAAGLMAPGVIGSEPLGPPTDAEVLRALPRLKADGAADVFRDDIVIVKNKLTDRTAGKVRTAHWECVAYWTETTRTADTTTRKNRTSVVYVDKNWLVK